MSWRKKEEMFILAVFFIIIFYLSIVLVSACSIDETPHFRIRTSSLHECYFTSNNETLSSDTNVVEFIKKKTETRNSDCGNLDLTESDQEIFRNIINKFNKKLYYIAHINIEKQSNTKYLDFQKQVEKVNTDKCDCERIDDVTRLGEWTAYVKSQDCEIGTMCQPIPPEGCSSRFTYNLLESPVTLVIIWIISLVPYIVIPVLLIIVIIRIFKKLKQRYEKKNRKK